MSYRFFSTSLASLLGSVVLSNASVFAEPGVHDQAIFDRLFAQRLQGVQATGGTEDDVQLFAEMLAASDSIPESPEVRRLIFHAVMDRGFGIGAVEPAVEARTRLARDFPEDPKAQVPYLVEQLELAYRRTRGDGRKAAGEALVEALQMSAGLEQGSGELDAALATLRRARLIARSIDSPQYDRVERAMDQVEHEKRLEARIAGLRGSLEQNPGNKAVARELALALVVEKQDAQGAQAVVEQSGDSKLVAVVGSLLKDAGELDAMEALLVADWAVEQSRVYERDGDLAYLLDVAVRYYDACLAGYGRQDALRLRVADSRDQAGKRLETLTRAEQEEQPGEADQGVDLIAAIDVRRHSLGEPLVKADGKLVSNTTDFILPIELTPDYDLHFRFKFIDGRDGLNFNLPLTNTSFNVEYSRFGHKRTELVGVEPIESPQHMLRPGSQVHLVIKVRNLEQNRVSFQLIVNDQTVIDWSGESNALRQQSHHLVPVQFGRAIRISCGGEFIFSQIQAVSHPTE